VSDDTGVPRGGALVPGRDIGTLTGVLLVVQVLERLDACAVVVMGVLRQPGPLAPHNNRKAGRSHTVQTTPVALTLCCNSSLFSSLTR
jgi:hypothetical protein